VTLRLPVPAGPHLVLGLARSGRAAALALAARGEPVIAVDAGEPDVTALRAAGIETHTGSDGLAQLPRARSVIKSPGVPDEAALVVAARAAGIPVMGELELAWRLLENEFIAVTGTNGKTTTVEWIGHVHREAALPVAVAGNVGTALSTLVGQVSPSATVVCEASSFQLHDTVAFAPEAGVLLNLTPDHLDRHRTMEAYRDAKLQIFARQGNDDIAVAPIGLGIEDLGGCARRVCFGAGGGAELELRAGVLWWDERALLPAAELSLPGAHNLQNAMATAAVTLARGVDPDAVVAGLRSFAGVAHRLETVAERGGVRFVNDSKATNVASTLVALDALAGAAPRLHLILGGQGKGQDFGALAAPVGRTCVAVYLIGEAGPLIGQALGASGVPRRACGDLEAAVAAASAAAQPGQVVLLSPACASFDQFSDFEARGERFRELVREG